MVFTMSRSSPIRIGSVCRTARRSWLPPVCLALSLLSGCRLDMHLQPKYNPEVPSNFFSDGRSARQPVTGTVARGQLRTDELLYAGKSDGNVADIFPFAIGTAELARGRERFNIYCSPCHGYAGYGDGMIVQRGFPAPPSFHDDRLRQAPVGHFFDVMTNGFGLMYSYASRVSPQDRWYIAAYIRALQRSQYTPMSDLSPTQSSALDGQP